MIKFNMKIAIYRRTLGAANPAGEQVETWPAVSGETSRSVNLSILSMGARATLNRAEPGTVKASTHQILCPKDTDVEVDDVIVDTDSNEYTVQSKEPFTRHYRIRCAMTGHTS